MGHVIEQTVYEALEPGVYRAQLTAVSLESGKFGTQVVMRWDLTEPGFEGRFIRYWANPKLSGGEKPSKLYTLCSMLLFGGKPLPEGWTLDIDTLLDKQARLVVEVKPDTGFNRIAQVLPIQTARAARPAAAPPAPAPAPARVNTRQTVPDDAEPPDWMDGEPDLPF